MVKKEEEIWLAINGYAGLYSISSPGRFKTVERSVNHPAGGTRKLRERILKLGKRDYLIVTLWKNGLSKTFTAHVLVAKHFIQNPQNKKCVNHKNGKKYDTRASNLEWNTHKENSNHAIRVLGVFNCGTKNLAHYDKEWEKEINIHGCIVRSKNDKLITSVLPMGVTFIDICHLGVGERAFRACIYRLRKAGVIIKTEVVQNPNRTNYHILKYSI